MKIMGSANNKMQKAVDTINVENHADPNCFIISETTIE
jgi:hypothetical protein